MCVVTGKQNRPLTYTPTQPPTYTLAKAMLESLHLPVSRLGLPLLAPPPSVSSRRILSPAPSRCSALAAAMAAAPPVSKAEYLKRYLSGADAGLEGGSESVRKRRKKRPKPGGAAGKG